MLKFLPAVLSAIKPSAEELDAETAFANLLISHIKDNSPPGCDVVLTGSVAKKTFLRDKRDIDIFVLFGRSVPRDTLEALIRAIMHASFPTLPYQISYAEHPYVRFHFQGRRIDLVPAYRIDNATERISAVDRSVLHTKFVLKALKGTDDVLLLKQFLKANELYGAEIKVGGFSGYLCELLIVRYGSFTALARNASKWKIPPFIDVGKHYKSRKDISGATERFGGLVVIDPTDKNRNVAAAVTPESLRKLIALCKGFNAKPSQEFFFRVPESFEAKVSKAARNNPAYVLSMPRPDVVDDVLWGQLKKLINQLETGLSEFKPKSIFADDSQHVVRIAFVFGKEKLPPKTLLEGPPVSMKESIADFKNKHKRSRFLVKGKKLWAEVRRTVVSPDTAIMRFFQEYSKTKSHLAFHREMLILERVAQKTRPKPRTKARRKR